MTPIGILLGIALAAPETAMPADERAPRPTWVDVTREAGIDWGATRLTGGAWNLIETMGGGAGFLDFDGDGWLDVYLVAYTRAPQADDRVPADALYRNRGDGTFEAVAPGVLPDRPFRGMGLAVADYDADGWPDLYVSGFREHRLYHNDGGRRLVDATAALAGPPPAWGTGAAFLDFDRDGDLDLFVASYLAVDPDGPIPCQMIADRPFCSIARFDGSPSALYRNEGGGVFSQVGEPAGVALPHGKGLGVVAADLDGDGWVDLFEANDTSPNHLFLNRGGRFEETGLLADVAYDASGRARGAMGVDVCGRDERLDVFVTNFTHESNAYFRNEGAGVFRDASREVGLAAPSIPMSGFGARFLDEDNDGRLDLAVSNGHPFEPVADVWPGITWAEPAFLFEGDGDSFRLADPARTAPLARPLVGRGLATGDYDNDGDPDLLLLAAGEPPRLLRNEGGHRNHWLGVTLVGAGGNRDAIGAQVLVTTARGTARAVRAGGTSYLSASDPRLLFGLGPARRVERLEVVWPDGSRETRGPLDADRYLTVAQGVHREGGGR